MNLKSLENKNLKILLDNNQNISVKYKTRIKDIVNDIYTEDELKDIYGFRINNEVKSYDEELVSNSLLEPIRFNDEDGYRIYLRTVKYILKMALNNIYKDLEVDICNTIDNNNYYIVKNKEFTSDMAVEILKEMRTIIARASNIERRVVSYDETMSIYNFQKDIKKLDDLGTKINSYISMYFCEDFLDSPNGVIAPNTSYAEEFDIKVFRKGFLLIVKKSTSIVTDSNPKENKIYSVYEQNNIFLDTLKIHSVNELNQQVISGNIKQVIGVSEALQSNDMYNLINKINEKEELKMILVAGPSSSGKTTFAYKLGISLKIINKNPVIISMDNYFKERKDTPKQANKEYDFETIEALELELFNKDIEVLLKGGTIQIPTFNFITGSKEYLGKTMKLEKDDILIIEGIHALNPKISINISTKEKFNIYIAPMTSLNINDFSKVSTTDTRMIRRIVRDYKTRGHSVEKTLKMWSNIVKGENENIYPYINRADYIFNTSLIYELGVLKTYADPLLLQVKNVSEYFSETRRLYNFLKIFLSIPVSEVPNDSLLNEFIGG